ncbi:Terminal uridylyltransferase 4 [Sorochytrium milnesiophthora]
MSAYLAAPTTAASTPAFGYPLAHYQHQPQHQQQHHRQGKETEQQELRQTHRTAPNHTQPTMPSAGKKGKGRSRRSSSVSSSSSSTSLVLRQGDDARSYAFRSRSQDSESNFQRQLRNHPTTSHGRSPPPVAASDAPSWRSHAPPYDDPSAYDVEGQHRYGWADTRAYEHASSHQQSRPLPLVSERNLHYHQQPVLAMSDAADTGHYSMSTQFHEPYRIPPNGESSSNPGVLHLQQSATGLGIASAPSEQPSHNVLLRPPPDVLGQDVSLHHHHHDEQQQQQQQVTHPEVARLTASQAHFALLESPIEPPLMFAPAGQEYASVETQTPSLEYLPPPELIPQCLPKDVERALSKELWGMYDVLLPSAADLHARTLFLDKMRKMFDREWPEKHVTVFLFGSAVNYLGTRNSDVDICLTSPKLADRNNARHMYDIASLLRKNGIHTVDMTKVHARVPVVRFTDPEFNVSCDINVNNPLALYNTLFVKHYATTHPVVRSFMLMVKYWTQRRVLNDAAGGSLSSYCWCIMMIYFLQRVGVVSVDAMEEVSAEFAQWEQPTKPKTPTILSRNVPSSAFSSFRSFETSSPTVSRVNTGESGDEEAATTAGKPPARTHANAVQQINSIPLPDASRLQLPSPTSEPASKELRADEVVTARCGDDSPARSYTLGALFYTFFRFYAFEFDYAERVVGVRGLETVDWDAVQMMMKSATGNAVGQWVQDLINQRYPAPVALSTAASQRSHDDLSAAAHNRPTDAGVADGVDAASTNAVPPASANRLFPKLVKFWHASQLPERDYRLLCVEDPLNPSRNLANNTTPVTIFGLRKEMWRTCFLLLRQREDDASFLLSGPQAVSTAPLSASSHHSAESDLDDISPRGFFLSQICEKFLFPAEHMPNAKHQPHHSDHGSQPVAQVLQHQAHQHAPRPHAPPPLAQPQPQSQPEHTAAADQTSSTSQQQAPHYQHSYVQQVQLIQSQSRPHLSRPAMQAQHHTELQQDASLYSAPLPPQAYYASAQTGAPSYYASALQSQSHAQQSASVADSNWYWVMHPYNVKRSSSHHGHEGISASARSDYSSSSQSRGPPQPASINGSRNYRSQHMQSSGKTNGYYDSARHSGSFPSRTERGSRGKHPNSYAHQPQSQSQQHHFHHAQQAQQHHSQADRRRSIYDSQGYVYYAPPSSSLESTRSGHSGRHSVMSDCSGSQAQQARAFSSAARSSRRPHSASGSVSSTTQHQTYRATSRNATTAAESVALSSDADVDTDADGDDALANSIDFMSGSSRSSLSNGRSRPYQHVMNYADSFQTPPCVTSFAPENGAEPSSDDGGSVSHYRYRRDQPPATGAAAAAAVASVPARHTHPPSTMPLIDSKTNLIMRHYRQTQERANADELKRTSWNAVAGDLIMPERRSSSRPGSVMAIAPYRSVSTIQTQPLVASADPSHGTNGYPPSAVDTGDTAQPQGSPDPLPIVTSPSQSWAQVVRKLSHQEDVGKLDAATASSSSTSPTISPLVSARNTPGASVETNDANKSPSGDVAHRAVQPARHSASQELPHSATSSSAATTPNKPAAASSSKTDTSTGAAADRTGATANSADASTLSVADGKQKAPEQTAHRQGATQLDRPAEEERGRRRKAKRKAHQHAHAQQQTTGGTTAVHDAPTPMDSPPTPPSAPAPAPAPAAASSGKKKAAAAARDNAPASDATSKGQQQQQPRHRKGDGKARRRSSSEQDDNAT